MRNELLKFISLCLAIVSVSATRSEAQSVGASSGPRLDRIEVQRFEQSYEAWVQSIVKHVLPKTNVSVLIDLNYSSNPDIIQSYEERRAVDHLPGLPDVQDTNRSNPTENPLYELVTQQSIKVIFDDQPSDDQIRVVKEILSVKLNLDTTHGDQVSFDHLQRNASAAGRLGAAIARTARSSTALIILALFGFAGIIFRKNRTSAKLRMQGEIEMNACYARVNPIASILNTEARVLISVFRKQETDFLVQVMAHAPIAFNQIVLQVFEEEERKKLFDSYQEQRLDVSRKKSKYSQLLLAAKLHDELKIEAMQQVDEFNEVSNRINEQRLSMQESLKQLKALYVSEESSQVETQDQEEVNHEASL